MTRVTLRDVATRAGVSTATASQVLTGNTTARVAPATRTRIERAAVDLAYRPNRLARGLVSDRTQTLALISDTLATDPFTGPLVQAASRRAAQLGQLLFVAETDELGTAGPGETHLLNRLIDHGVDGLLFAPATRRVLRTPPLPRDLPVVLLNAVPAPEQTQDGHVSVLPDDESAGAAVAHALIETGHRDGIHLVGEVTPHGPAGAERLRGLTLGLAEHGITLAAHHQVPWWPEPVRTALAPVLASATPPTAIVAANDRAALGVYEALARAGLHIPTDVSVVSFDDSFLATWLDPSLTSAALPYARMGALAVELLLDRSAPSTRPRRQGDAKSQGTPQPKAPTTLRLPMPLQHRASLCPPRLSGARTQR